MGAWQPRQQAAKPSAGVSVKIGWSSGVGQFRKRSLRSAAKAGRPRDYCRRLARTKSRGLLLLSSATGGASRRIAGPGRTQSRGHFCFEPPRARGCCTSGEPAA